MSELRNAALRLAGKGKPVFPCRPGGKEPLAALAPHGVKDATVDRAIVLQWWTREPDANVGLATGRPSGLFVLDVDPHHGGMATLAKLCAHDPNGLLTLEVETGGGGYHLYLSLPDGVDLTNSDAGIRNRFGPGVDCRGTGGYVIVPPSRHPSGGRYCWGPGTLRPVPGWLVEVLTTPEPASPAPPPRVLPASDDRRLLARFERHLDLMAAAANGNRNKTLHWCACRLAELLEEGAPGAWVGILEDAGVAAGLPEAEVRRTVASGLGRRAAS